MLACGMCAESADVRKSEADLRGIRRVGDGKPLASSYNGRMLRPEGSRPVGLTHVTVTLTASDGGGDRYTAEFLVDTGAFDSMAPGSELSRIGIRPVGQRRYELADGTVQEFAFGLARIEFMGEITAGRVIFGPEGIEPLLGVTALESAGMVVDPTTQTLKRLPAVSLK
jgi:clan AA aspartic protease